MSLLLLVINIWLSRLPIISFYWFIKIIEFLIIFSLAKKILVTLKEKYILVALLISGSFELFLSLIQLINKHSVQGVFIILVKDSKPFHPWGGQSVDSKHRVFTTIWYVFSSKFFSWFFSAFIFFCFNL